MFCEIASASDSAAWQASAAMTTRRATPTIFLMRPPVQVNGPNEVCRAELLTVVVLIRDVASRETAAPAACWRRVPGQRALDVTLASQIPRFARDDNS